MDRNNQSPIIRGRPVSTVDAAKANEFFEHFINAGTLKSILGTYRTICDLLHLKPNVLPLFYPKLKANLTSWRAKALWKKFDQRANAKCYGRGKICPNTRVLIIGAGPCGLRTAIEAQLLGAKVVVVEKRDRMSRNNVLHLWRFVIEDLRALGAKKFFGKFCAGAIDHISIRQVQCILLKVALLLGVEIHTEVSFEHLIEPNQEEKVAWRGQFKPADHPVSQFEFDVIIGADGKRNTLQGFQRKEFRGKLAIAITANFINKRTEAEARVEEISGVAFIFNQKFFKDLYAETGIDLENIVYYKDDTHYFVMTAKKASLINKRVIRQDLPDTAKLLAPENVDRDALMNYAREAAEFSTHYQMPNLEFAVNHYGQPDVAMFDFTSMYQAENASKIIERQGHKLLAILVGDSLLEPFWPTGSGCARGFLSSFDAAWAIRAWGLNQFSPLEIIAERESIYRLLAQTTPENLNKDYKAYTLDPSTRYPNLNKNLLLAHQMISFYDTDDRTTIELQPRAANVPDVPRKRRKRDSFVDPDTLLNWVRKQVREFHDVEIEDITSFRDGKILCAIIHHYRPDLIDYNAVQANDAAKNNQLAFDILEKEIGIPPVMTGEEMAGKSDLDFLALVSYLTQIYDTFRREIPHIKHPKMELTDIKRVEPTYKIIRHDFSQIAEQHKQAIRPHAYVRTPRRHVEPFNNYKNQVSSTERKSRKRRTSDKIGLSIEERQKRLEEIACNRTERQNKRRQQRKLQTEQFIKSMQMLQANALEPTGPFEDYSIFLYRQTAPNFEDRVKNLEKQFTYIPDRENARPSLTRGQTDEDFAARIKCIEDKYLEQAPTEKKPKDLLRAIGKIETTDWNIKEIEKKIQENKMGKPINKEKEKVPKWNREQFSARLTKMEKQHLERQDSTGGKFSEIDSKIKQLDQKLKEGTTRDLNQQKVATITEKLTSKVAEPESKPIQRSNSKSAMVLSTKTSSEYCHFCSRRVYLVERLSTEGKFFHRGCFRCQYCHTALRLNSYTYDRDGRYGHRFFCQQHFGMPGELYPCKIERKESQKGQKDAPQKIQTPERVEFENLSTEHISSEHEESISQMDEDEWTDRNFGQSAAELGSSDEYTSSSGTESDSEDNYVEALEEPFTKEGTLRWKERLQKRYSKKDDEDESDLDEYSSSDHSGYYDNMSDDDETDTATEGEEDIIARELRKQEVRVQPPVVHTDTGTDSEVSSNESSSGSSSDVQNSATEISTDSEFALEETTPTREVVEPFDRYVTKTRPNYHRLPKKVQVKSTILQKSDVRNNKPEDERRPRDTQLKFAPLVMDATTVTRKQFATKATTGALPNNAFLRHEGYALNRTQSTGGIAAKVSLELKKKYLLGESAVPGSIQKSGSVSTLDSKFKSFHSNITDCQKLLKPAPDISPSMKIFCSKLDERTTSPLLPSPTLLTSHSPPTFFNAKAQLAGEISEKESTKKSNHDDDDKVNVFENETEGRPRSPLHETSIIVPEIHWPKHKSNKKTDSLEETSSTESSSSTSDQGRQSKSGSNIFANIPRVEVHDDTGIVLNDEEDEMPFDSLNADASCDGPLIEAPKSITSERKTLNQPKPVPTVEPCSILTEVHNHVHIQQSNSGNDKVHTKLSNDRSTPSPVNNDSYADQATAALTETELSDWARDDDAVSDDCDEFNRDKLQNECINVAKLRAIEDTTKLPGNIDNVITECVNSILNPTNFDNIEFMDNNGTGTSSEENDDNGNNGYVQLRNEDESILADNLNGAELTKGDFEADSTSVIVEATNTTAIDVLTRNRFEDARNENEEQKLNDPGERNLDNNGIGATEAGTTTEENTCSDSTVKNVTEKLLRDDKSSRKSHDIEERANEADDGNDSKIIRNEEYEEHCQRLASKVEFGNAKDSIDIRKSKRKSKSEQQQPQEQQQRAPDLIIREEKEQINLNKLYKREEIEKERDINQRLIQEMVMNKMRAQNKSLERKKRSKVLSTAAASGPYDLTKSATTDLSIELRNNYNGANNKNVPPDLLTIMSLQKSQTVSDFNGRVTTRPLDNVHASNCAENNVLRIANNSDSASLPNLSQREQFKVHHNAASTDKSDRPDDELALNGNNNNNKSKQHKNKKSKENIYIEDSIESLVLNTERRNSFLYSNDTLRKKRNNSFRRSKSGEDHHRANAERLSLKLERPERKSVPDFGQLKLPIHHVDSNNRASSSTNVSRTHHKSDSNLLTNVETVKSDKRNHKKDVEQRKSFTKFLSDIFTAKKKDGASNAVTNKGGIFSKISPKGKGKSKSCVNLVELQNDTNQPKEANRRNSLTCPTRNCETPPPVPPLPYDYTLRKLLKDESSGNESDYRTNDDTLRRGDELCSRRNSRSGRKSCRQAQLKRHRLAQEIQRKLEEIDVKTRELERRGVLVEKALRGESNGTGCSNDRDDTDMLKEWFDLMRDRTELRRYEKELSIRARELELEDRHARLQQQLRERLDNAELKTEDDVKYESSIIKEMMDIVAKRDSLISLLEEDRLRYSEEDKDFEEQMLAKGLKLTPLAKTQ